jgi:hypothetical protein
MRSKSNAANAANSSIRIDSRRLRLLISLLLLFVSASAGQSQDTPPANARAADKQGSMRFSFSGASWRNVLEWLADEADLALHVDEVPTGSFTYSDRRSYTPDEAVNRINQFLIPKGFSLVRSGKLLSVISVEDTRSLKQLDVLAELVPVEELKNRGDFEVVKCLFPLGKADTQAAVRELSAVTLMMEPVQLPTTNQLLITDTVRKLRTVQKIIASLEDPNVTLDRVKSLPLDGIDAEAALAIIRPHVGLEGDTLIGGDISLSTDQAGKTLYVSGTKEQVDTVMSLVQTLKAPAESPDEDEKRTLQSHPVKGANLQTVFDVLQTLLAGEDARLSQEPATNSIVAFGPQQMHDTIDKTILTLKGSIVAFKIIDLKTVDPYYAVSLLKEMFSEAASDDPEAASIDQIKIDADPINMRLFVRAKPAQIEQMETVIEQLASPSEERANMRWLPYYGARGKQVLDTARGFWSGENPVLILPHGLEFDVPERAVHPRETKIQERPTSNRLPSVPDQPELPNTSQPSAEKAALQFVSQDDNQARVGVQQVEPTVKPPTLILGKLTPRGILIQSEDLNALDRFEKHLRMIAGPAQGEPMQTAVFYFKYAPIEEAAQLLRELLGSTPTEQSTFGSLVSGSPSPVTERAVNVNRARPNDEATTVAAGAATILTNPRLNRLIVIGTASDIALVEKYLPIIDKDTSLTDPETHGAPRVIQLRHARAEAAAAIIRDAYSGRIASTAREKQQAAQAQRQQQQQRNPQNQNQRGLQNQPQQNRPATSPASAEEPKFTLAVDTQSNSLIVTAPKQLADEVQELARQIDNNGAQTIRVISLNGGVSTKYVREALEGVLGDQIRSRPTVNGPRTPTR